MSRSAILSAALLLASCAGGPAATTPSPDPAIEEAAARAKAAADAPVDRNALLLDLEHGMLNYARALDNQGNMRSDRQAAALDHYLRQTVAREYEWLKALAADGEVPANQGIALAALGFSAKSEAMPLILQGLNLADKRLVDRAVFGLAMLRDPRTPVGPLAAIVEDSSYSEESRTQAAWTLYRLQGSGGKEEEIVDYWKNVLSRPPLTLPAGVVAMAVRGLGFARDPANAGLVAEKATHPVPWVRMMVAIALGRMNAQDHADVLISMLEPKETNANVRLAARTALRGLAGGTDRGYEVEEWRKVFDRGDRNPK
ncbi:MAG: hypothetical protein Fur0037_15180 [Planctomycetota bacterium]